MRLILNTGTTQIQLKASNLQEKLNWSQALLSAQGEASEKLPPEKNFQIGETEENSPILRQKTSPEIRKFFEESSLKILNQKIEQIWV